ncbi:MAG: hypothetical protein P4M05_28385 [Bradyrhizobium sp.]|nr:hypothetical protein [Bradyrhizobium sp.]
MAAVSSFKVTVDLSRDLEKATKTLLSRELLIGIPGDSTPRPEDKDGKQVSNAVIGYVQETGDEERGTPARPFLLPGVSAAKDPIAKGFKMAGRLVLDGDASGLDKGLTAAGLAAVAQVKRTILEGNFAPLAESTLKARARRRLASGKLSQAETSKAARRELAAREAGALPSTDARPLYDTHSMFNSITFVIKDKGQS